MMVFQIFIKKELLMSGLSKKDFALKIGLSRRMLDEYLCAGSQPKFDTAVRICKTLGKDIQIIDVSSDDNTLPKD